ncbi:MAG: DsrE family protein [Gammaproteobacteria bacterium]|nr:DsrE family protein [Gammaproteobacteria bacterium]MBU6508997.1 DsrE family protein [Gammaproteobacteria bacterium]MDE1983804.1 DsrE family protein [Gammaproteobacteria bacterium]MDE2108768.1 DsrE family protein [Gammaproteobacteria bacterium]
MNASILKTLGLAALLSLTGVLTMPTAQAAGTQWTYPAIAKYGPVHPLPQAAVQPDKHHVYKAIFDVTTGFKNPSEPESGLDHVARAVNTFVSAGVSVKNLRFVAVLHGPATTAVLNNAAYKAKYGVDNPNIPLIDALREAGVHVDVCGQALADMGIEHSEVYQNVRIDLSALATTVIYGDMGYAYMKQ